MKSQQISIGNKLTFQGAGALYLLIACIGTFSIGYMPRIIFSEANASVTFQNLMANQELFKWAILGDILVVILEIILSVLLYRLFEVYGKTGMLIATYARVGMAVIMGFNVINYTLPLIFTYSVDDSHVFVGEQIESLIYLFFQIHKNGELIWQLFFSVHLFTMGYVVWKSRQTPKLLGWFLLIGGIGYAGDSLTRLVHINSQIVTIVFSVLLVFAVIGELWFSFWLIFNRRK